MPRVLVIGASGLLGVPLCLQLKKLDVDFVKGSSRRDGDSLYINLCERGSIASALEESKATAVINCAAYTAVDDAEQDYTSAFALNAEGVGWLSQECVRLGLHLTHVSTDYVFGAGQQVVPYRESDSAAPLGVYGLSKWYGELLLASSLENTLIVRTSWLHGSAGPNFIDTMLRLAKSHKEVRVVNDQRGSLTWAPWLASCLAQLCLKEEAGIVHASSLGDISWYDVAVETFLQAGLGTKVVPVTSEEFSRAAPRPKYSALNTDRLSRVLSIPEFTWKNSISAHLSEI